MDSLIATVHNGHLEFAEPIIWPEGTTVIVSPCANPKASEEKESYADFIRRIAGSFGDEPFERPP